MPPCRLRRTSNRASAADLSFERNLSPIFYGRECESGWHVTTPRAPHGIGKSGSCSRRENAYLPTVESVHSRNLRVADESSALLQLNRHVTTVRRRIARAFPSLRTGDVSVQSRAARMSRRQWTSAGGACCPQCHHHAMPHQRFIAGSRLE